MKTKEQENGKEAGAKVVVKNDDTDVSKKELKAISDANKKMVAEKKGKAKPVVKEKGTSKKAVAKKAKGKGNGGFKPNPNSKANKIRLMFKEKPTWSLKEMTKRSGFLNDDNTRCMMSIFKNPTRTKELLVTEFNKEKQTYSLSK